MAQFAIENLTFSYPTDPEHPSLQEVSLQVEQGEYIALCGKSGSGKTTLLRHLKTVLTPHGNRTGSIFYEGAPLDQADLRKQSSEIGFVMQNPDSQIVTDKVWHELAFGLESLGCDQKTMRLRVAEMASYFGIQSWFHRDVAELSGGQKQRVAIARALAPSPKVLLCDEATSALDPTTTRSILSLLKEINRTLGITIVVITHEMSVIEEICDRVAIIDHSQIAEVGDVSDIFMNPKTEIAKRLLYASGRLGEEGLGERCLRIIFDGTQTSSPVICDMVLECGAPVNILFADTKTIEGKMHGYTLIQLPENRELGDKMKKYLDLHGVQYLEEAYHV